jgi:hypothetical protein
MTSGHPTSPERESSSPLAHHEGAQGRSRSRVVGSGRRADDAEMRKLMRVDLLILDLSRPRDYPDQDWVAALGHRPRRGLAVIEVGIISDPG